MPRYEPQELQPHELGLYITTNDTVSASAFGTLLVELERLAKDTRFFGPDAELRIVEIGLGSVRSKLELVFMAASAMGGIVSAHASMKSADISEKMAEFQIAAESRANRPNSNLAQSLATMHLDSSVATVDLTTDTGNSTIKVAGLAAVDLARIKRLEPPIGIGVSRATAKPRGVLEAEPIVDEAIAIPMETLRQKRPADIVQRAKTPVREGDTFRFEADGDLRGARGYLGQFADYGDGLFAFNAENGLRFGVIWDSDLLNGDTPQEFGIPLDERVMVRAQLDMANRSMIVFEFYEIDLPRD